MKPFEVNTAFLNALIDGNEIFVKMPKDNKGYYYIVMFLGMDTNQGGTVTAVGCIERIANRVGFSGFRFEECAYTHDFSVGYINYSTQSSSEGNFRYRSLVKSLKHLITTLGGGPRYSSQTITHILAEPLVRYEKLAFSVFGYVLKPNTME